MADKRSIRKRDGPSVASGPGLTANSAFDGVAAWLERVKFRKRMFGGVNERDVWKKIGELNDMYTKALIAERARYDTLLERQRQRDGGDAP